MFKVNWFELKNVYCVALGLELKKEMKKNGWDDERSGGGEVEKKRKERIEDEEERKGCITCLSFSSHEKSDRKSFFFDNW